jgi:hypothetical protein
MGLIRLAVTGLAGYGIYRWFSNKPAPMSAAFAAGESNDSGFSQVRNAGPAAMASASPQWDKVDQASDESFPASDAPGKY